ncbi:hypothetical protein [Paracoccus sp. FO-3]|uniref:hypothetical protein n=1 Tax=Paracoccus sp. FO-3 TaxID=1335059 RepID=UPI001128EE79|nr:hypothetical protein [Paracoccus sp. FO-3]
MTSRTIFQRQLRAITAHFRRYPDRPAPTTRTLECAFETNRDHSDAMAACLMLTPAIRPGLERWRVFDDEVRLASLKRHEGRTVRQIIDAIYPREAGR